MLGSEGVARAIVARLDERLPSKVEELRARLGVGDYDLPAVQENYPTEIDLYAIGEFPVTATTQVDTTGRLGNRQTELGGEFNEYSYRYRMRVYVWGAHDGTVKTDLLRKRLALAVRETLLERRILWDEGGNYVEVDPDTVRESYSDVGALETGAIIAGAYIEMECPSYERLDQFPAPGAPIGTVVASTEKVPDFPADYDPNP